VTTVTFSRQILFADGSYLLVSAMDGSYVDIWHAAWHRVGAYLLSQGSVIVLPRLGADAELLTLIYGLNFHGLTLLSLLWSWCLTKERRILMVLPFGSLFGFQASGLLFPSEVHVLAALFWPLLFSLMFPPAGSLYKAAVLIVAILWGFCHEASLISSPVLIFVALRSAATRTKHRAFLWIVAGLVGVGMAVSLLMVGEQDAVRSGNRDNFLGAWRQLRYHYLFLFCALATAGGLLATLLRPPYRTAVSWLLGAACVIGVAYVASRPELTRPEFHYAVRAALAVALPLLGMSAWAFMRAPDMLSAAVPALLLTALAQCAYASMLGLYWCGYLELYRNTLATRSGIVPVATTPFSSEFHNGRPLGRFNWNWAHLFLSLALSPEGRVNSVIVDPSRTYDPRDPTRPETWPTRRRAFDTAPLAGASSAPQ
jgi:hypothetical protein